MLHVLQMMMGGQMGPSGGPMGPGSRPMGPRGGPMGPGPMGPGPMGPGPMGPGGFMPRIHEGSPGVQLGMQRFYQLEYTPPVFVLYIT